MLKNKAQISCQSPEKLSPTQTKLENNSNKISPEIIRPKPRRVGGQQSDQQLSRHCTSSDLSQMNSRVSPDKDQLIPRPNTPLSPFRRNAVGGSAPVLSHITNRTDSSPKFSLSPIQSSPPVKNVSGRDSTVSVISQSPQKTIKTIRETPPIKQPLLNAKPRSVSTQSRIYEQIYSPVKQVTDIDRIESGMNQSQTIVMNNSMKESNSSHTECGSLSKSSSDGEHIINKKKVLSKIKSRRRNILCFASPATVVSDENTNFERLNINGKVRQGCYGGSSSDENRSSGHASMSDTRSSYFSSSPTDDIDVNHTKINHLITNEVSPHISNLYQRKLYSDECVNQFISNRHSNIRKSALKNRKKDNNESIFANSAENGAIGQLDCVRSAIEQIALRHGGHSTSTYSSNYSGSEYEPTFRRLIRHSSLETIGTNITSAGDDFVWIDSHSRLVELQHYPWNNQHVLRLLQQGRLKNQLNRISMESVPRLSYLLQRPLVRIASEAQRFARNLGMCTKHEICGAIKVVLSTSLADSCIKSGHRSAAMFAVSGPDNFRQSKSARAGLQFSVGKFHRWMCDVKLGNFVDEYAAIYMTSAIENLLEEIIIQCLSMQINEFVLTANLLDTCIQNNSDFWGLLQPFAHLNAGRTANGMLSLPAFHNYNNNSNDSVEEQNNTHFSQTKTIEQQLLTTCVGSVQELGDILHNVSQYRPTHPQSNRKSAQNCWSDYCWSPSALYSLYYYMRCAQLEHNTQMDDQKVSQELVYERPYLVLPPLYEWIRVSSAHANYRKSFTIDKDDVLQGARILLPGIDCPARQINHMNSDEWLYSRKDLDKNECTRRLKISLAFRMLGSGRTDLLSNALQLLPHNYGLNTINENGLTILMHACIGSDLQMVQMLVESGCNVNIETPNASNNNRYNNSLVMSETQFWSALTYATIHGSIDIARILLEKGANVEGGARYGEDRVTQTPLQLAASSGRIDLVKLLLSYGSDPFLSTSLKDSMTHCGATRGCPSAIAVAAIHGERMILRALLAHPLSNASKDVLSLEEMLAESSNYQTNDRRRIQIVAANQDPGNSTTVASDGSKVIQLTKSKLKTLQEAMYHSAENGFLEITLDLRNIGVPWTLHCWMQTLANAHEMRLDAITDQLLQDFLHLWPDDCSTQFVDECLPLLFSIFRHQKNEGTSLLLSDIFSTCYGKENIKPITSVSNPRGARIDAKYVNNKEMSDCVFKIENRLFYAHKIILVNASPKFQSMLSIKNNESNNSINDLSNCLTPIVITDVRYYIFQIVMQFLYNGGCDDFEVDDKDILELMCAAEHFQLDSLLRYCELRSSAFVDLENVVNIYIHSKVYNAYQLLEYCQGFVLQNLVALLTYDDSVRKLIFGKKLHNHDVLSGLLFTLQSRIRERHTRLSPTKNQFLSKRNPPII